MTGHRTLRRLSAWFVALSALLLCVAPGVRAQTPAPEATPAPSAAPAAWDSAKQGDENGVVNAGFITKYDGTLKDDSGKVINEKAPDFSSGDTAWVLVAASIRSLNDPWPGTLLCRYGSR
ncbi:MAG: hypothetical protein QM758_16215 [Armatimonas sp.]